MSRNTTEEPEMQIVYERPQPAPPHMTFEEFLAWDTEGHMAEWIGGEVFVMSPAAEKHQELIVFFIQTLGLYVKLKNLGRLLPAPFVMRVPGSAKGREPDLLFVSRERENLIERTFLNGAADLVVEIVSPESVGRDRGEKFVEYEAAGIREYWLIDPDREQAEFYQLGADGLYRAAVTPEGVFHSQVVAGFFVREAWLWQISAPTLEALRELKLI